MTGPEPAGRKRSGDPNPSDEYSLLLDRIREGDETALAEFYDRTSPIVFGIAMRVLGDAHHAEDATIDVYLQVWRDAHRFEPARSTALTWLSVMARSRSIDRLRSTERNRKREAPIDPDQFGDRFSDSHTPLEHVALRERRERVREGLKALGKLDRQVLEFAYFAGLTHTEISGRLQLPLGTVKTRIRRAMTALRRFLRDMNPEP